MSGNAITVCHRKRKLMRRPEAREARTPRAGTDSRRPSAAARRRAPPTPAHRPARPSAPAIQATSDCGPCIAWTISGMVRNGPAPIMLSMFSVVAARRPMRGRAAGAASGQRGRRGAWGHAAWARMDASPRDEQAGQSGALAHGREISGASGTASCAATSAATSRRRASPELEPHAPVDAERLEAHRFVQRRRCRRWAARCRQRR